MKKTACAICAALAAVLTASAGEIEIKEFKYAGPYTLTAPLMVDSTDVMGRTYHAKSLVETDVVPTLKADAQTLKADALPASSDAWAMHLVGFTLENTHFAEAELKVDGTNDYALYIDGKAQRAGKLTLEPATHELVIRYLTGPGHEGSPKVSLTSEHDDLIAIGPVEGGRMYTLTDVTTGIRIGGAEISPDGKYLLASYRINKPGGRSDRVTRLTEVASGRMLTETTERLSWMPRSTRYYLTRDDQGGGQQLICIDPATGAQTTLADGLPRGRFSIAPTEDFLIFSLEQEGPKERADVYEVIHPDDRQPGWRDRTYLARYDLATGVMQPITFGYHNVWEQDISDDGRYLLLSVSHDRLTQRPTTLTDLLLLDLQTLKADTLVKDDGFLGRASFSPDGSQVLLSGSPEALGGIGANVGEGQTPSMVDQQLFLMTLADRSIEPLTKDFNPSVERTNWSRADGHIYFTAEDRDCVHLFRMDGKTHRISLLDAREELVKGFSLAVTAPVMALYGESAGNAERLYTAQTKTMKTSLVRDLHAEQMADIALGECQPWDYINSRGDTICGRYYLPPHFDPEQQYPMIVNYYGGCSPTSRNFEGRYPHHAYAALGYVVYIVEPSGATGFGQEFSARHVNTAGDPVADDIIEGVRRFCEEHPFVNPKKIGCIGASYGGFMTQYLQTKTDLFAAAISHAGISDHTGYWGEGYWGYSYSEVSMANTYPWSDRDLYVGHSPLYNVDKIHTPLLFLHGDADHNVPVSESIQMYTALRLLGRETAMVLVKDQDHHILDYDKRARWQATIFAWFARWLQDDPTWWESMYPTKAL